MSRTYRAEVEARTKKRQDRAKRTARVNARIVWTADRGWHDGPSAVVALDERGRLTTKVVR